MKGNELEDTIVSVPDVRPFNERPVALPVAEGRVVNSEPDVILNGIAGVVDELPGEDEVPSTEMLVACEPDEVILKGLLVPTLLGPVEFVGNGGGVMLPAEEISVAVIDAPLLGALLSGEILLLSVIGAVPVAEG